MTALITLAELKSFIAVRDGVTKFDAKLQTVILTASAMIETACRRSFTKAPREDRFAPGNTASTLLDLYGSSITGFSTGVRAQSITLSGFPVDTSAGFDVRYDVSGAFGDDTIISPEHYTLDAEKGVLRLRYPTRHVSGALRIAYTAGWETDGDPDFPTLSASAPSVLKQACIMQAMFMWNRLDPNTIGMTSDDDAKGTNNTFVVRGGILPDAAMLLAPFRRILTGGA